MNGPFASRDMNEIHAYWLAKRGQRRMPSRWDIDPAEIPRLLRNLMLIDVSHDPIRFRYRLIGSNVVDATGEDRTRRWFDTVDFIAANPIVKEQYVTAVNTGEPVHATEPFHLRGTRLTYEVERLLLPLSSDSGAVDMILAYFDFKRDGFVAR